MNRLIDAMEIAVEDEAVGKSVKFATVLFTVVSKYSALCLGHEELLLSIASKCTSFMAKTTCRAINKLNKTAT